MPFFLHLLRCQKQILAALPRTFASAKRIKELSVSKQEEARHCTSRQHREGLSSQCDTDMSKITKFKPESYQIRYPRPCKSESGFEKNSCASLDSPDLQSKLKLARTWCFATESAHVFQCGCCQRLVPGEELLTGGGAGLLRGAEELHGGNSVFYASSLTQSKRNFLLEKTSFLRQQHPHCAEEGQT